MYWTGNRRQMTEDRAKNQHVSRWLSLVVAFSLLSSIFCPLSAAQEAAASKIGYVNLGRVFDNYQRTKDSESQLERKGSQKQAELESRVGELKKMRDGLELLSDSVRAAKAKELEAKSDEFQSLKTKSQRELLRERNENARVILDDVEHAVAEFAKANGFSMILDQRSLLYGTDVYDATDEVLKMLNERYASKAAKSR